MKKLFTIFFFFVVLFQGCSKQKSQEKTKKRILVFPSSRYEIKELSRARYTKKYEFVFHEFTELRPKNRSCKINYLTLLDTILQKYDAHDFDGVYSTEDHLGCLLASLVAQTWSKPGPNPQSLALLQHKYYLKKQAKNIIPEATGTTTIIKEKNLEKLKSRSYPLFVKPAKGSFSQDAQKIDTYQELQNLLKEYNPKIDLLAPYNQYFKKYAHKKYDGSFLVAETLFTGKQITLEGFVQNTKTHIIGITDSKMHPDKFSFKQFIFPSTLSKQTQKRMCSTAKKLITHAQFNNSVFNIEFMYNPKTKTIGLIEVNTRPAVQFCDLYEKVLGWNNFDAALAIAVGEKFKPKNQSTQHKIATSYVLRAFHNGLITRVPTTKEKRAVLKKFPQSRVRIITKKFKALAQTCLDGRSSVYGFVHLGGRSQDDLERKVKTATSMLPFKFLCIR